MGTGPPLVPKSNVIHGNPRQSARRRSATHQRRFRSLEPKTPPVTQKPRSRIAPRRSPVRVRLAPSQRSAGIGSVGAVRAGADGLGEVLAERWMVFADALYALAHSASHTGSRALGRGCRPPIALTHADRACELSHQEVALGVRLSLPLGI